MTNYLDAYEAINRPTEIPEVVLPPRADTGDCDRGVWVELRGERISSDGGQLVMRELDNALGLSERATTT